MFVLDISSATPTTKSQQLPSGFTYVKSRSSILTNEIGGKAVDMYDVYLFDECGRLSTVLKSPYSVVRWYPGAL